MVQTLQGNGIGRQEYVSCSVINGVAQCPTETFGNAKVAIQLTECNVMSK